MSITPIDMATMAPKSQEVTLHKQQESQKPFQEQLQASSQFKNEIRQNSRQTVKTSKGDNPEYRYDAKEKGNNSYNGNKQKKKKEKEPDSGSNKKTTSIDIRI